MIEHRFVRVFSKVALTFFALSLLACASDDPPPPGCDGSLVVEVNSVSGSDCGTMMGSISVDGSGGSGPYEFSLNQGTFQSSGEFTGLAPGTYTIRVRDRNGCQSDMDVTVLSGVLLAEIRPIIDTNCAVPDCHNGSSDLPNFTNDQVLTNTAAFVRGRTGNRSMPPPSSGNMLTDAEIQLIACWANDVVN